MTAPVEVGMRVYVLTHYVPETFKGLGYIRSIHATELEAKAMPLGPGHSPECCTVQEWAIAPVVRRHPKVTTPSRMTDEKAEAVEHRHHWVETKDWPSIPGRVFECFGCRGLRGNIVLRDDTDDR